MEKFIRLQNILNDPKKCFEDFKSELVNSQITQFTYICLLLNIAATIKRNIFNFQPYLDLLSNFKKDSNFISSCINYVGYKDKISILMNACEKSVASTVFILSHHPEIKLHLLDPNGYNAIFYAIRNSDQNEGLKILEILKDMSPSMLDIISINSYTPLFLAVQKLRFKIIQYLLQNQSDPNQRLNNSGNTVLHQFFKIAPKFSLEQIKKMIQIFAKWNFDFQSKNILGKTVEQHIFDLHINLVDLISEFKASKPYSEFGSESQIELISSKMATTKICESLTNLNSSQIQDRDLNDLDKLRVSKNSLLSDINHLNYKDEIRSQFSDQILRIQSEYCHQNEDFESDNNQQISRIQYSSSSQNDSDQVSSQNNFLTDENIDYEKISLDMLEFNNISQKIYFETWNEFQPFFHQLENIVKEFGLYIQVIGSFATGLWTYHSDIDIALVTISQDYINFQKLLQSIYLKLKMNISSMGIKDIMYNRSTKFSSIKIYMDSDYYTVKEVDIMIFYKKYTGIIYVNFVRQSLMLSPEIKPIFFFLKRVCQEFQLHDPFNGGLKSYSIFLMIMYMVKTLEYKNLAELILKISLYYGFYHEYGYAFAEKDYENTLNQHQNVKLVLNIQDPINTKNNLGGRNTNAGRLRDMFRCIFYGLHHNLKNGTNLQFILQTGSIV